MIRKIFIAFNIIFMFNVNLFCKDFNIFNSEQYILSSYLDALKQENREKVRENIPNFTDFSFYNDDGDVYLEWYKIMPIERMCYNQLLNIGKSKGKNDITIGDAHYFIIDFQCNIEENIIEVFGKESDYNYQSDYTSAINWDLIRDGPKTINLIFNFDGDYVDIYYKESGKENLFVSFCKVNQKTYNEFESLVRYNKCDLSCVTWPRHADGSCDYEESTKTGVVLSSFKTDVSINKVMSVTENLKLRSGEATITQVLTVMQAGTKVKILELGKAENIDGIDTNWVKVEIISGKDRNGKELKSGLSGWCYGGYLQ